MSAASKVLSCLHNVKQVKPGDWVAGCPCCQSKRGRPVSVRESGERVLIHGFCGCETTDILESLGLSLSDLFDRPLVHHLPPIPDRPRLNYTDARELLIACDTDLLVANVVLDGIIESRCANEAQRKMLTGIAARIGKARDAIAPVKVSANGR